MNPMNFMNNMNMNNMNQMNNMIQMNNMNLMNNMNQMNLMNNMNMNMNNMNNMNQMNLMNNMNMNNMNNINQMNNMNNMNNMNKMNQMNNMNNMNQMNNMNNMNQMNNMNNMNNINHMNQMNNMNNMNQMNNMNNMNQMNNINNMGIMNNNQNNMSPPMKGIKNYSNNTGEASYANCVLQSLACLDCIRNWFKQLNNNLVMNNMNIPFTKEFYLLLYNLYSKNQVDSTNIILQFFNKASLICNKEIKKDPYHFLFYFLQIFHKENNNPMNPNFDQNVYNNQITANMNNHDFIYNLFGSYFQQTQNSLISKFFYNIEKYEFKCPNCSSHYSYSFKNIISFDVEKYKTFRNEYNPQKIGMNLNLQECLQCYQGGYGNQCPKCGNFNGQSFINIFSTNKVLIFNFKRKNHIAQGDIDFNMKFQINNKNYILKACISYCNMPKYFTDVNINNIWYRYMEDNLKMLSDVNKEIHEFEPHLLIYEQDESSYLQFNNNQNNNQIFTNNFNFNQNMGNNF